MKIISFIILLFITMNSYSQCPDGYTSTGTERAINGDFTNGNVNFTSEYTFIENTGVTNELQPEGKYSVWSNPHDLHPNFSVCSDISGNGLFMILNGSPTENLKVWTQSITVEQNTLYYFVTQVTSVHTTSPARLQFSVNDVLLGEIFTASSTTCLWNQFYATWNSGSNTTATISIVNKNTTASGNDFALDKISFMPCSLNISLPVELLNFRLEQINGEAIQTSWSTASETNNNYFVVERATNNFEFDSIGTIRSSDINSNHVNFYNFLDTKPNNGTTYYRLKQVDYDGNTEYFSPKSVYFDRDIEGFKIYYDSEKYRMDLYGVEGGQKVKFTLRNIKGDKIYEDEVICKCNPECCVIDLKDKLPFGLYSLTWDTRGKLFTHKFIAH